MTVYYIDYSILVNMYSQYSIWQCRIGTLTLEFNMAMFARYIMFMFGYVLSIFMFNLLKDGHQEF